MKAKVIKIKVEETYEWLKYRHYAKRIPQIMEAFGLYNDSELVGIVTYGIPPSPTLCRGVCGDKYFLDVYELNRLCLLNNKKNEASFLVARSLKLLPKPKIIVSYADTNWDHVGYIYQATNFLYTGLSAKRTDVDSGDNRHAKTTFADPKIDNSKRKNRSQKHRYIYFLGSKKQVRQMHQDLNYSVLPYPKGEHKRYDASFVPNTQQLLL